MGRGRKGPLNQSTKKANSNRYQSDPIIQGRLYKSGKTKINLPEQAFEFMKNINPQQLTDLLLSDGDWHVKTSGIAAGIPLVEEM